MSSQKNHLQVQMIYGEQGSVVFAILGNTDMSRKHPLLP